MLTHANYGVLKSAGRAEIAGWHWDCAGDHGRFAVRRGGFGGQHVICGETGDQHSEDEGANGNFHCIYPLVTIVTIF